MRILLLNCVLFIGLLSGPNAQSSLGNKDAPVGGTFLFNIDEAPTTINPFSATDAYSQRVHAYVIDSLLARNADTYDWEPALATSWEIKDDGKIFEFKLRQGVKWHDGKPVTVEDVKFSFDAIVDKDNKYGTAHLRPYYEDIEKVEIVDPSTVRFYTKKVYFKNFEMAAGLSILPAHIYKDPSDKQKKKLNRTLVASGPYQLVDFSRGKHIELKRNKDWWGNSTDENKGQYNFNKILMKFVKDETIALTMIEKGDLDFNAMTAESFVKKTTGPKWGKSAHKVKIENSAPKGYSFMGFNLKSPIFESKKTRLALYHLVNREMMIEKFLYGLSSPSTGPLYTQSDYADKSVKPVSYDPKKALSLLKEDGWADKDGDQILEKEINGQRVKLSFTVLEPLQDFVKYLTIFKEDAKKAGVDVNIKYVEWNTFIKLLDERKFDVVRLAWGGGSVDWDPKQVWHSSSHENSGSNFVGYNNPEVDKLIDEARGTLDKKKREKILQKVFRLVSEDVPYVFFFNPTYGFYGHTDRMKRVKDTYRYSIGATYWWAGK